MMASAICIKCGTEKTAPWKKCQNCRFDPSKNEDDLVKSVYLSSGRYEDQEKQKKYMHELDNIGELIKNGQSPSFDSDDLERLREQKHDVESISLLTVFKTLFRLFLPAIIFLAILYGLLLFLKLCMK